MYTSLDQSYFPIDPVEVQQPIAGKRCSVELRTAPSAHGNGHVDAQVAVVGEQVGDGCVEDEAVTVHDRCGHTVMNGSRRRFPREPPAVAVQLEAVGEVLSLFASADEEHDGKELLMALVLFLLLQHQHEMVAEAGLHHDPVHSAGQVDVCGQEDDVLAL